VHVQSPRWDFHMEYGQSQQWSKEHAASTRFHGGNEGTQGSRLEVLLVQGNGVWQDFSGSSPWFAFKRTSTYHPVGNALVPPSSDIGPATGRRKSRERYPAHPPASESRNSTEGYPVSVCCCAAGVHQEPNNKGWFP